MNYCAYMIKSESSGRHYYGHTSDLKDRMNSHNSSQNRFTRGKGPWIFIGFIACSSKSEAVKIERMLKKMKNPSRAISEN
jgi:putative endonuclease